MCVYTCICICMYLCIYTYTYTHTQSFDPALRLWLKDGHFPFLSNQLSPCPNYFLHPTPCLGLSISFSDRYVPAVCICPNCPRTRYHTSRLSPYALEPGKFIQINQCKGIPAKSHPACAISAVPYCSSMLLLCPLVQPTVWPCLATFIWSCKKQKFLHSIYPGVNVLFPAITRIIKSYKSLLPKQWTKEGKHIFKKKSFSLFFVILHKRCLWNMQMETLNMQVDIKF